MPERPLADAVASGDRAALARAITLAESGLAADRARAVELIDALLPKTGSAQRVGIAGPPGVGKSTLIEALGLKLIAAGHRVAVLAIDPSSPRGGGSILADKTRMTRLANEPNAFVRPTPAAGTLGGAGRRTREAMLLAEAAGYDIVIVESVGIGQSETVLADLVDHFLVLVAPGGGDDLQGLKKGVIEVADSLAVTKADGELAGAAARTAAAYRGAIGLSRQDPSGAGLAVLEISAATGAGLDDLWRRIAAAHEAGLADGSLARRRKAQETAALRRLVEEALLARFFADPDCRAQFAATEARVASGEISAGHAADLILAWSDRRC